MNYTVKPGDSLSRIAARLAGDARRWPELVTSNPALHLRTPFTIYVGEVLAVPSSWRSSSTSSSSSSDAAGPADGLAVDKNGLPWFTDAFCNAFLAASVRLKMNPADWLLVLYSESSVAAWAAGKNVDGVPIAFGINQITDIARGNAGLLDEATWARFPKMSALEQLPFAENYFRRGGLARRGGTPFPNASSIYLVNAAPAFVGRGDAPGMVIYPAGSANYQSNTGLDRERKGFITLSDLTRRLVSVQHETLFVAELARINAAAASSPAIAGPGPFTPTISGSAPSSAIARGAPVVVGGVVLAAVLLILWGNEAFT